jgi:parallel beta-helix repeat protein
MNKNLLTLFLILAVITTKATVFTVTDTVDGTTSDGVSLRWAITQANSVFTNDTIQFNIPGMAPHTITVSSNLPTISDNGLLIDGSSQPPNGYAGNWPKIILTNGDTATKGLYFFVPYTARAKGLEIKNFTEEGIYGLGSSAFLTVEDCKLSNNYDGIGLFGSSMHGDIRRCHITENLHDGVYVFGASAYALIEYNLVSGNEHNGITIYGGSDSCTIRGNYIGTDSTGQMPYGNTLDGIYVANSSNVIGGWLAGEGNIIGYNGGDGVEVSSGQYNWITRNSMFCNAGIGIQLGGSGNGNYAAPVIQSATTAGAAGTATANSRVELYYDSACTNCQGKVFIADVITDNAGAWIYNGSLINGSSITATASDTVNHNTSRFALCVLVGATGMSHLANTLFLGVSPNPVSENSIVTFNYPSSGEKKEIIIHSIHGKEIVRYALPPFSSTQTMRLPQMAVGVYVARLTSSFEFPVLNVKFVVE